MSFSVRTDYASLEPCEHGGRVAEIAAARPSVLDFSASFNPFLHPRMESILHEALNAVYSYPDHRYARFRKAIAKYLSVSPDSVVPGNGSLELIRLCTSALLEKGDKVVIPAPTFSEYELACRLSGATPLIVPLGRGSAFREALSQALSEQAVKMVFLCNPNNPTGQGLTQEAIIDIVTTCAEHHTFLFLDEVFIELSNPQHSIASANYEDVFVLRSLTKSFAVPGLRVGYGITQPVLAAALNRIRLPWNLNGIAEAAAVDLLEDCTSYLEMSRAKIAEERDRLFSELRQIAGLEPLESDANFIMIEVTDTSVSSTELAHRMLAQGLIIRDCSTFRLTGRNYIRIAVRTKPENDILLSAMRRVLDLDA